MHYKKLWYLDFIFYVIVSDQKYKHTHLQTSLPLPPIYESAMRPVRVCVLCIAQVAGHKCRIETFFISHICWTSLYLLLHNIPHFRLKSISYLLFQISNRNLQYFICICFLQKSSYPQISTKYLLKSNLFFSDAWCSDMLVCCVGEATLKV